MGATIDLCIIPEFVDLLSSHLDQLTLARCARVCKSWHALFLPNVWHTFGNLPGRPIRFGVAHPPTQFCYQPPRLPLFVPSTLQYPRGGQLPADNAGRWLFAFAGPELYPENGSYQYDSWNPGKSSMWKRLFARAPVSAEEIEAMRAVLAKHGHLVRCLVVRSVQAFRIASPYCTNLQAFHCRFEPFEWQYTWRWYLDMTVAEAKQVNREITQFVLRLKSQLIALHLMAGLMDPQCIHDVMHAVGTASFHPHHHRLLLKRYRTRVCHWVHFDSPLSETDYLHVNTLLPMVETARFAIRDLSILAAPLETKHYHLQELDLQIQGFDHKILQNVRASFPNLRRLFVRAEDSGVGFDLIIDQGATMLYVGASIDPNEVASMIPLLPDLMVFDYHELNPACVAALAQHCSRLRFISTDRWVHRREGHDHPENHPTSVTPLLTSCPYLERVNTPTASIHMSDLVVDGQQENAASWVCTQLKYLNCQLVGIPTIESVEREVYESLIARTPEIHALHHQQIGEEETVKEMTRTMMLTGLEQDVLRKMLLRDRCRRILEKQLCLCPNATTWIEGFGAL